MNTQNHARRLIISVIAAFCVGLAGCGGSDEEETSAPPSGASLLFDNLRTDESSRAWSFVLASYLRFYGEPAEPCGLQSRFVFEEGNACCEFRPECGRSASLEEIKGLAEQKPEEHVFTIIPPLPFDEIRQQIDRQNPILLEYGNSSRPHYAAIFGYDADSLQVYIEDPLYGRFVVPYSSRFHYAGGNFLWTRSLLRQPAPEPEEESAPALSL